MCVSVLYLKASDKIDFCNLSTFSRFSFKSFSTLEILSNSASSLDTIFFCSSIDGSGISRFCNPLFDICMIPVEPVIYFLSCRFASWVSKQYAKYFSAKIPGSGLIMLMSPPITTMQMVS